MQWYRENYTSMFPTDTTSSGINLRDEMHTMLYGNAACGLLAFRAIQIQKCRRSSEGQVREIAPGACAECRRPSTDMGEGAFLCYLSSFRYLIDGGDEASWYYRIDRLDTAQAATEQRAGFVRRLSQ